MASAPPTLPHPQQSAPPPSTHGSSQNNQPRSGGRNGGRGNHGGRGNGGRGGGNHARGGVGRGDSNYSNGRGRGGNHSSYNLPSRNNGPPTPHPSSSVPYGHLPAFLPGASSMVEQLDRKCLVILRDGRHLVGILRTFDQFSNMVLQEASERRILVVSKEQSEDNSTKGNTVPPPTICYQTDIQLGLFIVRGDNVVLLGEVDDDEEQNEDHIRFVSLEEFEQIEDQEAKRKEDSGGGDEPINWDFDMDLVA